MEKWNCPTQKFRRKSGLGVGPVKFLVSISKCGSLHANVAFLELPNVVLELLVIGIYRQKLALVQILKNCY